MSDFTDEHKRGVAAFTESLRHKTIGCDHCGFEDTVLQSAWKTDVHTEPRNGHVVYELTCPDCNETTDVEINI